MNTQISAAASHLGRYQGWGDQEPPDAETALEHVHRSGSIADVHKTLVWSTMQLDLVRSAFDPRRVSGGERVIRALEGLDWVESHRAPHPLLDGSGAKAMHTALRIEGRPDGPRLGVTGWMVWPDGTTRGFRTVCETPLDGSPLQARALYRMVVRCAATGSSEPAVAVSASGWNRVDFGASVQPNRAALPSAAYMLARREVLVRVVRDLGLSQPRVDAAALNLLQTSRLTDLFGPYLSLLRQTPRGIERPLFALDNALVGREQITRHDRGGEADALDAARELVYGVGDLQSPRMRERLADWGIPVREQPRPAQQCPRLLARAKVLALELAINASHRADLPFRPAPFEHCVSRPEPEQGHAQPAPLRRAAARP